MHMNSIETVSYTHLDVYKRQARNWCKNAKGSYDLSIEKFVSLVNEYCEKKGPNHHVIFLVDEIGQYIADDTQLMLNLQTIVEDLGTSCRGKAWVIVTSQEDIDSITKTKGCLLYTSRCV